MNPPLHNPQQRPDDELLKSALNSRYKSYQALCDSLDHLGISREWNYYKDGKSWLCKALYKKKTVLWLSVWEDCFKVSFHFTEKTKSGLSGLDISPEIKSDFSRQKPAGKLIPLILEIRDDLLLSDITTIAAYKITLK